MNEGQGRGGVPPWLLGRWRLQRAEEGVEILPGTLMEFRGSGVLVYRIPLEGEAHVFELEYSVRGDLLCTRHAAAGHAQTVRFGQPVAGELELDFAGVRAWFSRETLM